MAALAGLFPSLSTLMSLLQVEVQPVGSQGTGSSFPAPSLLPLHSKTG